MSARRRSTPPATSGWGSADQGVRSGLGDIGQGARGGSVALEREQAIEEAGQAAIEHHFACSQRWPLDYDLVEDGIAYLCRECDKRVRVGADGQPVTAVEPEPTPTPERRAGRPKGTGRAIPTEARLLEEVRRVRNSIGRSPSLAEFAVSATNAADGSKGVGRQTVRDALGEFGYKSWPEFIARHFS